MRVVVGVAEITDLRRYLKAAATRQLPFATARALSDVARSSSDHVASRLGRHFKLRRQRLKKAVTWKGAKKGDRPITSHVGTRPWASFLTLHSTGGWKRGKGGSRVAVPTRLVKRTASGAIRKAQKPRRLRDSKGFRREELEQRERIAVRGRRKRLGGNTQGIFYNLVRRARIRKTWPIRAEVKSEVRRTYGPALKRRIGEALRTRRRG